MPETSIFSNPPIFLPNARDSHLANAGFRLPAIIMDARDVQLRPGVADQMRGLTRLFLVDPSTDVLLFPAAKERTGFKKLGYPKDFNLERVYSDPEYRRAIVVKYSIEGQLKMGATVIVAPYFFAEDTDDTKFTTNISLLSESIRYLADNNQSVPLLAMIKIGRSILNRPTVVNYVVDRYNDLSEKIRGYIVVINDLDCATAETEMLVEYARLVFQLSEVRPVIVNRIGPFGEILSAIGASGFGSGLASGESFVARNLQVAPKGWAKKVEKTYVPEIFDYMNDVNIKRVKYTCSCSVCKGSYPQGNEAKKLHFLNKRMEIIRSLQGKTREQQIDFVARKINGAIRRTAELRKQAIDVKTAFLPKWQTVLTLARTWQFPGNDEDLEKLLEDLDK